MKKAEVSLSGFRVRAWRCSCGEELLHPIDAEKVFLFNKLKDRKIEASVGMSNRSFIIRIPKEIAETYKLQKGEKLEIVPETPKKFLIETGE
ncbi:MAG: AbrB/MazE/SpoVT family DNA-binding domain-containing protein [Candidatus Aenigmarchaeota archaeon]|nr:AbrB/MazE/SpoVT family DNA-binding domain-containing protein [Candidatus Aenigmarchaeota archaeon]